jgi:hypothetical protein
VAEKEVTVGKPDGALTVRLTAGLVMLFPSESTTVAFTW